MNRHWTDKTLTDELKKMSVITDTREQVNGHITDYFRQKKIETITRKLDVGDYSAQIGDITFERDIAVERKASIDEICGNLTADRDRFEREFMRARANGTKVYLIIEGATWADIYAHNYVSKLSEKSLLASLLSWITRYNVTITFCRPAETPKIIYSILYYAVREQLLNNG